MLFESLVTIRTCDVISAIIAIPLVLRKVPRNVIYGFRMRTILKNDFVWYDNTAQFLSNNLIILCFTTGELYRLTKTKKVLLYEIYFRLYVFPSDCPFQTAGFCTF